MDIILGVILLIQLVINYILFRRLHNFEKKTNSAVKQVKDDIRQFKHDFRGYKRDSNRERQGNYKRLKKRFDKLNSAEEVAKSNRRRTKKKLDAFIEHLGFSATTKLQPSKVYQFTEQKEKPKKDNDE